ncbi:uncharacterized protein LOC106653840 [Trichogramma pretiosum]|uniref:uncharacterized protein LOC106653840 n=1 Tax=Trichogramma pretiosum TaxID=7493 RepID=UPI000C71B652|nr:uncharacterized protein LOC106653840 [Trichogramma pretiosum]
MYSNDDDADLPTLEYMIKDWTSKYRNVNTRRNAFASVIKLGATMSVESSFNRFLITLMNSEGMFPNVEESKIYFLEFALEERDLNMVKLIEASDLKIHEVRCLDGRSALHYLAEFIYGGNYHTPSPKNMTLEVMAYFLENPSENFCDDYGYTYLHAACMTGNVAAVNLFLSQGVDVNLDSYKYSPLHIAAQYRHLNVIEILLRHGADPNQQDVEKSTPLHALARLCLCRCTNHYLFCDKRKPVDEIVQILVEHGANIEARNCHGETPLQAAASRFDVNLTKALLDHGASLDNLDEDKMFSADFTSLELKNYPLTLNIIEMMHLLKSVGYEINVHTRLKMIKCWMRVRGNDTDHLIGDVTLGNNRDFFTGCTIMDSLFSLSHIGFYMKQETKDFLQCHSQRLLSTCSRMQCKPRSVENTACMWKDVSKIKDIMIKDDVSLYQLCQMSYTDGYSIIKNIKNWCVPSMDVISCTWLNMVVKRHIANILIRLQLELFVADLFMTDYCKLNLPYTVCRTVAEKMSYEELLRLCEHTKEYVYPHRQDSWNSSLLKFYRILTRSLTGSSTGTWYPKDYLYT